MARSAKEKKNQTEEPLEKKLWKTAGLQKQMERRHMILMRLLKKLQNNFLTRMGNFINNF